MKATINWPYDLHPAVGANVTRDGKVIGKVVGVQTDPDWYSALVDIELDDAPDKWTFDFEVSLLRPFTFAHGYQQKPHVQPGPETRPWDLPDGCPCGAKGTCAHCCCPMAHHLHTDAPCPMCSHRSRKPASDQIAEQTKELIDTYLGRTGPHSRACGIREHVHGTACHSNCPTCHGKPLQE